jgi:hypothetical protein
MSPRVEDQVATGTSAILESPHVTEGPGRIANAPVPSVYVSREKTGRRRVVCLGTMTLASCCLLTVVCSVGSLE